LKLTEHSNSQPLFPPTPVSYKGRAMAHVVFTANIQQHVDCPPVEAEGRTVREVLEATFRSNPQARSYVLDDQGAIRKHMVVFVNGRAINDRSGLSDVVPEGGEVYVMQALSGG
jgi:molybdopterin converting factor small subunit